MGRRGLVGGLEDSVLTLVWTELSVRPMFSSVFYLPHSFELTEK